jgi:hypothetical protein
MGLIEAGKLFDDISHTITESSSQEDWIKLINEQPVVYDVNMVIEKIRRSPSDGLATVLRDGREEMIYKSVVYDIIRRGGIDE